MGKVQRFGSISRVKPEKLEYYKKITCKSMATDQCNDQRVQY